MTDGHDDWRPPPNVPRSAAFKFAFCGDPTCGLHLVSLDAHDNPICETVMSADQTARLVETCRDFLYEKATQR